MAKTVYPGLNMKPRPSDKALRSFAGIMAIACVILGLALLMRGNPEFLLAWAIATLFFVTGAIRPKWLYWVHFIWMKFAFVLAWINTRLLLGIIFYFILTPVSLAMRLFRFDPLDRAFDRNKTSYWIPRPKKTFAKSDYERLY